MSFLLRIVLPFTMFQALLISSCNEDGRSVSNELQTINEVSSKDKKEIQEQICAHFKQADLHILELARGRCMNSAFKDQKESLSALKLKMRDEERYDEKSRTEFDIEYSSIVSEISKKCAEQFTYKGPCE